MSSQEGAAALTATVATHADDADTPLALLDVSRPERFRAGTHWECFARLRREDPVHRCGESAYGPYWSITRFDDIVAVEADYRSFSSDGNVIIGDVPPEFDLTRAFVTSDPPRHTRERRAVAPAVSRARMARMQERTRANVAALLDGLPRGEPFDWVTRVTNELTTQMMAVLFEFPWDQRRQLSRWAEVVLTTPHTGGVTTTWEERAAIIDEYRAAILDMWYQRLKTPGDDIISALANNPDTAPLADNLGGLIGIVTLMSSANEASRGALAGSVVAVHRFPGEWAKLRADPSLAANAAAEIIRWQTPISHMRRTATDDLEFRGKSLRKGDRVVMWYCSGNRDETHFANADVLGLDRVNARAHLGFGTGIHRCLGSHVAEMQLRVLLQEMLKRCPRLELVAEPRRTLSNFSAGYDEVLVRIPA